MLISKLIAARIAYGVDRTVQANALSPVAVKSWELNVAAHPTWLRYVTNFQQKGTSPNLDSGGPRDDAFDALMAVIAPRYVPGRVHGITASFDATVSNAVLDLSSDATEQISIANAKDGYGDAVASEHYTYSSNLPSKATVSSTGLVTGIAIAATVIITVTASSGAIDTVTFSVQA